MKHHFLRGCSTSESGGSKVQSCLKRAVKPRCSAHALWWQDPGDLLSSSSAAQQCDRRPALPKNKPSGADTVSMPWLLQGRLNLRGELIHFQSLRGFSSLGYWPEGIEKCNVGNKLPIKIQTLCIKPEGPQVSHRYMTGHSALKNEAGQGETQWSSFQLDVFYSLSVCHI